MKFGSLLLLVAVLAFASCKKDKNTFNEPVKVTIYDTHDTGTGSHLHFWIRTEKNHDCSNVRLQATTERNGNEIILTIKGLLLPLQCDHHPAYALGDLDAGTLGNGTYKVTIKNGSSESSGILTVNDEEYVLDFASNNNVSFVYTNMNKTPAHTIWGWLRYSTPGARLLAQQFTDSLVYYGAKPFAGPEGHYSFFNIGPDKNIINPYNDSSLHNFVYSYSNDYKYLDTLVKHFNRQFPDTISSSVQTWDGKFFYVPMD